MTKDELLNKLGIKIQSIRKIKSQTVINNKYIYKKMTRKSDLYDYLLTRGFNHFPRVYSKVGDEIELMDYINSKNIPKEQRLEDLVYITSILHLNTSFDKVIDIDKIKEIYETTTNRLEYIKKHYLDKQNEIEEELYMSPSNYLLIRNISTLYKSIDLSKYYLDKWYTLVKDNTNIRYSFIHGNLKDDNILEDDNIYLISWDKSRIDFPIIDLEILYKNNYLDINIDNILSIYQKKYKLKEEETFLLFSYLLIPDVLNNYSSEYLRTKDVSNTVLYFDKTYNLLKNYSKESNNNTNNQY